MPREDKSMKCGQIALKDDDYLLTWERFLESTYAETAHGQLLIALVEEDVWSSEYRIQANLSLTPYCSDLYISHNALLKNLLIRDDCGWSSVEWTVKRVENEIRQRLRSEMEIAIATIDDLSLKADASRRALYNLRIAKARAAVAITFPEAAEVQHIQTEEASDLFAFKATGQDRHGAPIFVTKETEYEFGDVARLYVTPSDWFFNTSEDRRHALFEEALAKDKPR
ncbi:MAG: hypothetical protein ACYC4I_01140 [Minisyncoccota bacterium]